MNDPLYEPRKNDVFYKAVEDFVNEFYRIPEILRSLSARYSDKFMSRDDLLSELEFLGTQTDQKMTRNLEIILKQIGRYRANASKNEKAKKYMREYRLKQKFSTNIEPIEDDNS